MCFPITKKKKQVRKTTRCLYRTGNELVVVLGLEQHVHHQICSKYPESKTTTTTTTTILAQNNTRTAKRTQKENGPHLIQWSGEDPRHPTLRRRSQEDW